MSHGCHVYSLKTQNDNKGLTAIALKTKRSMNPFSHPFSSLSRLSGPSLAPSFCNGEDSKALRLLIACSLSSPTFFVIGLLFIASKREYHLSLFLSLTSPLDLRYVFINYLEEELKELPTLHRD